LWRDQLFNYFIKWKEEEKNPLQYLLKAWFFMLWTLLGLGHDTLLAFFPFLACILEVAPSLQVCTCNNKENIKPVDKQKI